MLRIILQVDSFIGACQTALDSKAWQAHGNSAKAGIAAGLAMLLGAQQEIITLETHPQLSIMIEPDLEHMQSCLQVGTNF